MREIHTLRAMWRGLETTHGSDTEALSTETESKQSRPNLRSIGASPRPYRGADVLFASSASEATRSTHLLNWFGNLPQHRWFTGLCH